MAFSWMGLVLHHTPQATGYISHGPPFNWATLMFRGLAVVPSGVLHRPVLLPSAYQLNL
jgi:hypothetical protein